MFLVQAGYGRIFKGFWDCGDPYKPAPVDGAKKLALGDSGIETKLVASGGPSGCNLLARISLTPQV